MSSLGCQLDLEKVKLTFQILPSVKTSLDRILVSPVVIVVYPVTMFCISFLKCKGSVACDATFGTDPLAMRADLIESNERLFQYATFRTKHINTWSNGNLHNRKRQYL